MNNNSSATNALLESLERLHSAGKEYTELGLAQREASMLGTSFLNINDDLRKGWNDIADFCLKIDDRVSSKITEFIDSIRAFCEATDYNEEIFWYSVKRIMSLNEEIINLCYDSFGNFGGSPDFWYNGGIGSKNGREIIG